LSVAEKAKIINKIFDGKSFKLSPSATVEQTAGETLSTLASLIPGKTCPLSQLFFFRRHVMRR
jgi:hypothetical protein